MWNLDWCSVQTFPAFPKGNSKRRHKNWEGSNKPFYDKIIVTWITEGCASIGCFYSHSVVLPRGDGWVICNELANILERDFYSLCQPAGRSFTFYQNIKLTCWADAALFPWNFTSRVRYPFNKLNYELLLNKCSFALFFRSRESANLEYLKNIVLRFMMSTSYSVKQQMITAIATVLEFSPKEVFPHLSLGKI